MNANLIVTYDPAHAGAAKEEVDALLKAAKTKAKFLKSDIDGVFMLRVSNPKALCKKLNGQKALLKKMQAVFHWIPIDKWVKSDVKSMSSAAASFGKKIGQKERWKMDLNKRLWDKMHTTDLIIKLTDGIDKPNVDLEKPEKIVQVEIIKDKAGLALLKPEEKVNIPALK